MINSIQHFEEFGIKKLGEVVETFMKNPTDLASLVYGIRDEVVALGLGILKESLEECNHLIRGDRKRKEGWEIVKTDTKELTTSLGAVTFEKTLFKHKETGEECYLLDRVLELEKHGRLTEDAQARLLEEAVQSSYRRGGEAASLDDGAGVSKQTVKNKVHGLKFPPPLAPEEKKVVDFLYIDADEDHVPLQFKERKGDLVVGGNNWKNNCVLAKLVYVYEGIEPEAFKSDRFRLVNPYYFSGVYDGEANQELWEEVYQYVDSHYDLEKVEKVYLNGDGAAWIRAGESRVAGITFVLDGFHLGQCLNRMTSHLCDSAPDARSELRAAIKDGTRADFDSVVERVDDCTGTESGHRRVSGQASYLRSNWTPAKLRLGGEESVVGCSAEGHVSHVLSSRMSSRPMGWSRNGADKMARLRAYYFNGRDMLELVRFQQRELPKVAGMEEVILSCTEVLRSEANKNYDLGKYSERMSHSIGGSIKKKLAMRSHIMGL